MKGSIIFAALFAIGFSTTVQAQPSKEEEPYDPFKYVLPTKKEIEQYEKYAKASPKDASILAMLAFLYVRDARETGISSGYDKAAATMEEALKLQPDNLGAIYVKAVVHSANHRFRESLELAELTYKKNPKVHGLLMLIGDAQLELGDVDAAEKSYETLQKLSPRAYIDSRRARLAFVRGKPDEAIKWMQTSLKGEMFAGITKEGRSWYLMRMGELYFEVGNLELAEKYAKDAHELHPKYPPTLGLLASVKVAQGKHKEAIELYQEGIAINSDLGMLSDLGDLYLQMGNKELAKQYHDRFLKEAKKDPANAHELAEHYCNHDHHVAEALELTEKDLKTRKNVHAYDAYAWALYKTGKYQEADAAMKQATRWGTKEAELLYHAGLIQQKLGHRDQAKTLLKQALTMNPHFSILQAPKARQALQDLEKE